MSATIRTISQLPAITHLELNNNSKFEVSMPVQLSIETQDEENPIIKLYKFASKSITARELSKKISADVRSGLISENGLSAGMRIDGLCSFVSALAYGDFVLSGEKRFLNDPKIDNSPLSSYALTDDSLNDYSVNYETLKKYSAVNSSPLIGPNFGFVTRLSGIDDDAHESERMLNIFKPVVSESGQIISFSDVPYFVFNANAKNIAPNEYVFKIKPGKRESDPWIAPASGIFTCYGWLDEINNPSQSNETRWVALMGKQSQLYENGWAILQVQPFIKNNYLSYVGFTFPVKKGMALKVVTGFAVGNNSNKYFNASGSLTNHVGNAFLGGIYTGLSADTGNGENYDYQDFNAGYALSSDLINLSTEIFEHERECDETISGQISALSNAISSIISDSELGLNGVRYIDTARYDKAPRYAELRMYNKMFSWDANKKDDGYTQKCLLNGEINDNAPLLYMSLSEIAANNIRHYYAPPTTTQMMESGQMAYVEQAYYYAGIEDLYGRVFSDGKYMFYCVSQDCTAIIRLMSDISPRIYTSIAGYMLLPATANGNVDNMVAVNIGKSTEILGSATDPAHPISLPVKKGTIFMFVPWGRERVTDNAKFKEVIAQESTTTMTKSVWTSVNMPCDVPNANGAYTYLGNVYEKSENVLTATLYEQSIPYKTYAIWTANDIQRAKLVDSNHVDSNLKYKWMFGTGSSYNENDGNRIATVTELP